MMIILSQSDRPRSWGHRGRGPRPGHGRGSRCRRRSVGKSLQCFILTRQLVLADSALLQCLTGACSHGHHLLEWLMAIFNFKVVRRMKVLKVWNKTNCHTSKGLGNSHENRGGPSGISHQRPSPLQENILNQVYKHPGEG